MCHAVERLKDDNRAKRLLQSLLSRKVDNMNKAADRIKAEAEAKKQVKEVFAKILALSKDIKQDGTTVSGTFEDCEVRGKMIDGETLSISILGTVATAGKLALGAQAEAGANLRTALSQNPYSGSVLSAPSISF